MIGLFTPSTKKKTPPTFYSSHERNCFFFFFNEQKRPFEWWNKGGPVNDSVIILLFFQKQIFLTLHFYHIINEERYLGVVGEVSRNTKFKAIIWFFCWCSFTLIIFTLFIDESFQEIFVFNYTLVIIIFFFAEHAANFFCSF